jgi:hypothetical protein
MTHDEIMEMAEKCGFHPWKIKTPQDLLDLISFAKLVAAAERQRIADHLDEVMCGDYSALRERVRSGVLWP